MHRDPGQLPRGAGASGLLCKDEPAVGQQVPVRQHPDPGADDAGRPESVCRRDDPHGANAGGSRDFADLPPAMVQLPAGGQHKRRGQDHGAAATRCGPDAVRVPRRAGRAGPGRPVEAVQRPGGDLPLQGFFIAPRWQRGSGARGPRADRLAAGLRGVPPHRGEVGPGGAGELAEGRLLCAQKKAWTTLRDLESLVRKLLHTKAGQADACPAFHLVELFPGRKARSASSYSPDSSSHRR